jgi:transposase
VEVAEVDVYAERVGACDIGKAVVVACVRVVAGTRVRSQVRTFTTMTADLLALADWLAGERVELVVMEATGDYWKPVFYLLEDRCERVWLVNARDVAKVPGRKSDVQDAAWLAQVAQHGLVSASFVPPPPIRRLRDLTRQRTNLVTERARAVNRLDKTLEDAGIKTSAVLSKTLSVSSRAMIEALIGGERDPQLLADLARTRARAKIPDLRRALVGRFTDHHAFLARQALTHIDSIDAQLAAFTARIEVEIAPFHAALDLLITIPGVSRRTAEIIIAETGGDMTRFATPAALARWAGVCPGLNTSAGRQLSAATGHGDTWLKGALGDAAAAAAHSKNGYLGAYYRRLAKRRGARRALVATMHKILIAVWHMLTTNTAYHDLGADHWHNTPHQLQRRRARLIAELTALGVDTHNLAA